ncbi:rhamnan synthesis F family protein [Parasynechococcus sp.]|uniref:rhamnosyltransferase WsaF family glycosyltransferase n=1 Tax=Parasynechococcus sp. TaxID=3101203 RepID=UPI0037043F13
MAKTNASAGALSKLGRATQRTATKSLQAIQPGRLLPTRWRRRLRTLGFSGRSNTQQRPSNRKKPLSQELKTFLANIDTTKLKTSEFKDTKYLCHYAYVFDHDYYRHQLPTEEAKKLQSAGDFVLHYCTSGWKKGLDPSELFETNSYLSKYPDVKKEGYNPMRHFFQFGIHENRCSMDDIQFMRKMADLKKVRTLTPSTEQQWAAIQSKRFAVILHIHYPELSHTIANYLKRIPFKFDAYISTRSDSIEALESCFSSISNINHLEIKHFPNQGRDVGPFLAGFGDKIQHYDYLLKLHSKKSPHSNALSGWFLHCLDNLIGSEEVIQTNLLALSESDHGLVYPVENYALSLGIKHDSCWGHEKGNYQKAQPLLNKLGLESINEKSTFQFPVGTMFWCKTDILQPLIDWKLHFEDFDTEGGQIDGTLAHSIERLIGLCCTEYYQKKLVSTYCGYHHSKQHKGDKSIIEGRNKLSMHGFEKVIQFREKPLNHERPFSWEIKTDKLNIHWVIPNFTPGLGGHTTIFRAIDYLERCGHQCTIWVHSELKGDKRNRPSQLHKRIIDQFFIKLQTDQVFLLGNDQSDLDLVSGDVVIATDRMSTYPVLGMGNFIERFYFVQDYEPYFFARGTATFLTEEAYRSKHGFHCICASPWLQKLMEQHGNQAMAFPLAVDHQTYAQDASIPRERNKIAFYVRRSTPRRLYELGVLALRRLFDLGEAFEIITFGEKDVPDLGIPAKTTHAGILDAPSLAKLYREATAGLVLSGTNYSLVPNEMMACGLPVVDIDAEQTRLSYEAGTAVLAEATPDGLAEALQSLLNDQEIQQQRREAGLAATRDLSWDQSNGRVESFLKSTVEQALQRHPIRPMLCQSIKVSIVIPVFNGGDLLLEVVQACLNQHLDHGFELIIIDSESTDGAIERIPKDPRITIIPIQKKHFGHGKTRNFGASQAKGMYVAFITQDALPANSFWLANLIEPLEKDPQVAGVFGCHIAHRSHSQLTTHDLDNHFNRWIYRSHRIPIELDPARQTPTGAVASHERFYSDNNSCLRRSVWEQHPLPDVIYGEDQLWAGMILRLGYRKAYASNAVVRHSHEYSFRETVIRANTEWHFYSLHLNEKLPSSKKEVLAMVEESCKNDKKAVDLYPEISKEQLKQRRKLHFARACGYYLAGQGRGTIRP